MEWLTNPEIWVALFTLTVLEIVLGIDNIIMISILVSRMPKHMQARTRIFGLALAMVTRILLLLSITWVMRLTDDLFVVFGQGISGRDLILIFGGLFLIYKAVHEIHEKLEGAHSEQKGPGKAVTFGAVIVQILLLDIVFSFDSVITAVGMVDSLLVIIVAVVLSFGVMLFSSKFIFTFVNRHPTVKMLALAFLVLIGVTLVADGFGTHIDKALIYVPMLFAIVVEALNLTYKSRVEKRAGKKIEPVALRHAYTKSPDADAIAAATSHEPGAGSVTLSSKPVSGTPGGETTHGLG